MALGKATWILNGGDVLDLGLTGKVVIVTGATANIGRAIALDLAADGTKLVAAGRDEEASARLVAEAKEQGASDAVFARADMTDPQSLLAVVAAACQLGPI